MHPLILFVLLYLLSMCFGLPAAVILIGAIHFSGVFDVP